MRPIYPASSTALSCFLSISVTLLIHSEHYYKSFHSKSTLKIVRKGLNEMVYDIFAKEKKKKEKEKDTKAKHIAFYSQYSPVSGVLFLVVVFLEIPTPASGDIPVMTFRIKASWFVLFSVTEGSEYHQCVIHGQWKKICWCKRYKWWTLRFESWILITKVYSVYLNLFFCSICKEEAVSWQRSWSNFFFFLHDCINSLQIYRMKLLVAMLMVAMFRQSPERTCYFEEYYMNGLSCIWLDEGRRWSKVLVICLGVFFFVRC